MSPLALQACLPPLRTHCPALRVPCGCPYCRSPLIVTRRACDRGDDNKGMPAVQRLDVDYRMTLARPVAASAHESSY
eukprot:9275757-Pyramimonas_sp.AAC.1